MKLKYPESKLCVTKGTNLFCSKESFGRYLIKNNKVYKRRYATEELLVSAVIPSGHLVYFKISQQSMMKAAIFIAFVALASVVLARPDGTYTARYDGVNVPEILMNEKLRISYVKCMVGEGKCTPEGKELQGHIKEGIETDCAKCTDIQRQRSREVMDYLRKYDLPSWNKLTAKFDPTGEYTAKHKEELEKTTA